MRVRTRPLVFIGVTGLLLILAGFEPMAVVFLLLTTFMLLQFATGPLSLLIARIGYSIRWKFEIAITLMALLFLSVGLISFSSMDFMHTELHAIQDIGPDRSFEVLQAVDGLEDTQHSLLFTMVPFLGVLGVLAIADPRVGDGPVGDNSGAPHGGEDGKNRDRRFHRAGGGRERRRAGGAGRRPQRDLSRVGQASGGDGGSGT